MKWTDKKPLMIASGISCIFWLIGSIASFYKGHPYFAVGSLLSSFWAAYSFTIYRKRPN